MQEQESRERIHSQMWWASIKNDPNALLGWLFDQYRGEVTAGDRIRQLRDLYTQKKTHPHRILTKIARQEDLHARWVGELLLARGVTPTAQPRPEKAHMENRYWKRTLPSVTNFATGAALGAHAERMRLHRIEAIAADEEAPKDIRAVFARILPQERFHARAFASLAEGASKDGQALALTEDAHLAGMQLLGLVP